MQRRTKFPKGEIIHFHDEEGESCFYLDEEGEGIWSYDGKLRLYVEGNLIFNLSGVFVACFHKGWILSGEDGSHALFCKYSIGELRPPIKMRKHMQPRVESMAYEPKMETVKLPRVRQVWTTNSIEQWFDKADQLLLATA